MRSKQCERMGGRRGVIVIIAGLGVLSFGGCAADSSKPAPTMTEEQVRRNADKAFDKLQHEEKNRTPGTGTSSY